jgi:hypothetical protein
VDRGVLVGFSDTLRCFDLDVAEVGRGGLAHLAVGGAPGPASDCLFRSGSSSAVSSLRWRAGPSTATGSGSAASARRHSAARSVWVLSAGIPSPCFSRARGGSESEPGT